MFVVAFGVSLAECLMCGTPVFAFIRGAMKELIQEGKTGFLVNTVEEAVTAVGNIPSINRYDCHRHAMDNFSQEKMVTHYLEVYKRIAGTA